MRRTLMIVLVALPGLLLALAGYHHPRGLDLTTANEWWTAHVPLVPVFPLLGVALWVLLRQETGPVAWIGKIGAYLFGCFYTALDCLAGIAAGLVLETEGRGQQSIIELIALGDRLSYIGTASYLVATVCVAGLLFRRAGWAVLPGAVLLIGAAIPFQTSHIFWPTGVVAMLLTGLGAGLVEWARPVPAGTGDREGMRIS
ncbi:MULTISPECIES: hypothetical protein [unclassified Pseudonocardia]|uniref:hypothetical protein n=1 Tax=unclassified Pseudonocardia TaxID=2619320 RepID=UPI0001FFE2CE|nr:MULTISPECIES: hypothetical protein [unclassified Pseudonocardia]OLM20847.1 hypothetical protein Ae707Ps1_5106c [Pseudonocardia sp. Ae707_Ps1]